MQSHLKSGLVCFALAVMALGCGGQEETLSTVDVATAQSAATGADNGCMQGCINVEHASREECDRYHDAHPELPESVYLNCLDGCVEQYRRCTRACLLVGPPAPFRDYSQAR